MAKRIQQTTIMHRAVVHNDLIFLGGITADDPSKDMAGQMQSVCHKLDRILEAAGSDRGHLLSATIFLADLSMKAQMNTVWTRWLDPAVLPARATIGGCDLGKDVLVEVVVVASKP